MNAPETPADLAEDATACILCGGRGGWWSAEFREQCGRCRQTGWEPSATVRRRIASAGAA